MLRERYVCNVIQIALNLLHYIKLVAHCKFQQYHVRHSIRGMTNIWEIAGIRHVEYTFPCFFFPSDREILRAVTKRRNWSGILSSECMSYSRQNINGLSTLWSRWMCLTWTAKTIVGGDQTLRSDKSNLKYHLDLSQQCAKCRDVAKLAFNSAWIAIGGRFLDHRIRPKFRH